MNGEGRRGIGRESRPNSMHLIIYDALIRCKDGAGMCTQSANPLITFKSSAVAQPVLLSEPDRGTPNTNKRSDDWARDVIR
jgi:hypothetical protein